MQQAVGLCRSRDVVRGSAAALTAQRHMRIGRRWDLAGITLDRAGARWAAEWRSAPIIADQEQGLGGVVRVRTWLAHELSGYCERDAARLASHHR